MIFTGIAEALHNSFPDIHIHTETIEQGFQRPCFYLAEISASQTLERGNRYEADHLIDVHYFGGGELRKVASKLYDVLEIIHVQGKQIRGNNMNHQIVDGVLHFFVTYSYYLAGNEPQADKMEEITHQGGIK
jgi:hypothetical protein